MTEIRVLGARRTAAPSLCLSPAFTLGTELSPGPGAPRERLQGSSRGGLHAAELLSTPVSGVPVPSTVGGGAPTQLAVLPSFSAWGTAAPPPSWGAQPLGTSRPTPGLLASLSGTPTLHSLPRLTYPPKDTSSCPSYSLRPKIASRGCPCCPRRRGGPYRNPHPHGRRDLRCPERLSPCACSVGHTNREGLRSGDSRPQPGAWPVPCQPSAHTTTPTGPDRSHRQRCPGYLCFTVPLGYKVGVPTTPHSLRFADSLEQVAGLRKGLSLRLRRGCPGGVGGQAASRSR